MRFVLFDRIAELHKGREARLIKNVSQCEDYFIDHFPGFPVVPGSIILGSFEQGAEILLAASFEFTLLPVLKSISRASLRRFVVPGDQMEISLVMNSDFPNDVKASAQVQGKRVAEAKLTFSLEQAEADPKAAAACERLRRLHELIASSPISNVWALWEQQS